MMCFSSFYHKIMFNAVKNAKGILISYFHSYGERGGSVVECRTPEREVWGSKPTSAVLCP